MSELRSRIRIHAFLRHLTSWMDPAPGPERLSLIGVDRYGMVHILNSLFSVPVGPNSTERRPLDFSWEIQPKGLPPATEIPIASFVVCRAVCDVLRENHLVHVEIIPPSIWQTIPYTRAGKHVEYSK